MGFKNKEKCTKTLYHRTKEFNLNSANEKVFSILVPPVGGIDALI